MWEQEVTFLAEDQAKRLSVKYNPQTGDIELVRFWPVDRHEQAESLGRFLNTYATAKGAQVARTTVVDPLADKKTYPGTFRHVQAEAGRRRTGSEETTGVFQTLRLNGGYSRTGIRSGASCSAIEISDYYYNITNPDLYVISSTQANGVSQSRDEQSNGDGSFNVQVKTRTTQYRAMESTLVQQTGLSSAYLHKQLGVTTQAISSISSPAIGDVYRRSIDLKDDCSKDVDTTLERSEPRSVYHASRRTRFMREDTAIYHNARAQLDAPTPSGSGIYNVTQRLNEDLTYTGDLTYRSSNNQGVLYFAARRSGLVYDDNAIYRSHSVHVDAPVSGQGGVYDVTNSLSDDGLYDSSLTYRRSVAQSVYYVSERGPFHIESSAIYENSSVYIEAPDAVNGLYRATNSLNEDLTYRGSLVYRTGRLSVYAPFASHRATLRLDDSLMYRSSPVKIDAPTAGQGGLYDASSSVSEDGLYSGDLVYRFQPDVSHKYASRRSPFLTEDSLVYSASRVSVEAPVPTSGLYSVNSRENEDGTYAAELMYRIGNNTGRAEFNSRSSGLRLDITSIYRSMTSPMASPAGPPEQGTIYDTSNNLGDDGLYDATSLYAVSREGSVVFLSTSSPMGMETEAIYRNSRAALESPSAARGIYRTSNNLNEDKTYDASLIYRIGRAGSFSFTSVVAKDRTVGLYIYRGQTSIPSVPANSDPQTVDQITGSEQEDGLYAYTREISVDKKWFDNEISWTEKSVETFRVPSYATGQTNGVWYTRLASQTAYRYLYTFTMKLFSTPEDAHAYISTNYVGSHVTRWGLWWMGVKVEISSVTA